MKTEAMDKTLKDDLGNTCRIEIHQIGPVTFEMYIHDFNDSVPKRFTGTLKQCGTRAELWLHFRNLEGFKPE